jgi:copper homeostasis protein
MAMSRILIEVAMESVEDAIAAEEGGADRLELCAALDLGGLTPSLGMYDAVRHICKLPVFVMIRPRGGDFVYSDFEIAAMKRDITYFLPLKPDGFVFGILHADASINLNACRDLLLVASGIPCTFHRAFDRTANNLQALDDCVALGFKRVLTSGRAADAIGGIRNLSRLAEQAESRIGLLPCGRIRHDNVTEIVRATSCREIHGSFAEPIPDGTQDGERGYVRRSRTSLAAVAACRDVLNSLETKAS